MRDLTKAVSNSFFTKMAPPFFAQTLGFAILLVALLATTGCGEVATARYRITVNVHDNGRIYTGNGVREKKIVTGFFSPGVYFRGEAIPVKIGTKGILFVLPTTRSREAPWQPKAFDAVDYLSALYGERARYARGQDRLGWTYLEEIANIGKMKGQSRQLDCKTTHYTVECPFMLTLTNMTVPSSAVPVDPANLSAVFGPGVSLQPLIFTITTERVTTGEVQKAIPWLKQYSDKNFDGGPQDNTRVGQRNVAAVISCQSFMENCDK